MIWYASIQVSSKHMVMLACVLSWVQLFARPWTVACQAHLPMELSGQEYWSGLSFSLQRIFPSQRLNLHLLASPVLADGFFTTSVAWEAPSNLLSLISLYEEDI